MEDAISSMIEDMAEEAIYAIIDIMEKYGIPESQRCLISYNVTRRVYVSCVASLKLLGYEVQE